MTRRKIYTGKINAERTAVVPTRGQGISSSRPIKIRGGRQKVAKLGLPTGSRVKFQFPETKDRKTQYNYAVELL